MTPIRVLLADDHSIFREGLAALLVKRKDLQVVGQAKDGKEAFQKAKELKPDLVLMDIYMPGGGGLEATRRITEAFPSTKVIILTVSEEDKNLFEAIKCGAVGYLLKEIEMEELLDMLRGVSRGEAPVSRATANKILNEFAKHARKSQAEINEERLTPREQQVLELLTQGLTNKKIANQLGITEDTVKGHLKNILGKLHLANRVEAATLALKKGLITY
jgi:DNA-binding NarL/FixJ family response regulator